MALDDLKETIETLRERIQTHRAYLEGNETRTRQVLIDPMLHKLGWDIGDPNSVELEYRIGRDWADYVLIGSGRPIAVIEAKVLGKSLDEKRTMQALNYANSAGIPYMTLTNGDHWRLLEVFKQAPIKDRILMEFQLTQDEPYTCALQALGLWRPNLASGEPKEAATPVLIEKPAHAESEPSPPESTVPNSGQEAIDPSNNGDWMSLTSLKVERGQKPPTFIKFPNSSPIPIKYWITLMESIAKHLIETDKLSARDCPVSRASKGKSKQYLIHTEPIHASGKEFEQKRKVGKDLWLYSFLGSVGVHRNACWLLEKSGIDPSTVLVRTNRN